MSAKIWLGFGCCKFEADYDPVSETYAYTATFTGGDGKIGFNPIQLVKTNINHNLVSRLLGYRVEIQTNELYNIADDDYEEYQKLAQILKYLVHTTGDSQKAVTITPRNDTGLDSNLDYKCILSGNVSPTDLHRCKTGQVMSLKWQCITMQTSIPEFVSDTTANNYADDLGFTYEDDSAVLYEDGLG